MKFTHFLPGIGWFIISTIVLCLPGNDLPHSSWFDIPYFDKYVHFGIFFLLVVLFSFPFTKVGLPPYKVGSWFTSISLYALVFGIAIEFIQKYLVSNRSFDVMDIVFDGLGAAVGALAMWQWYKKNRPR